MFRNDCTRPRSITSLTLRYESRNFLLKAWGDRPESRQSAVDRSPWGPKTDHRDRIPLREPSLWRMNGGTDRVNKRADRTPKSTHLFRSLGGFPEED